MAAIFLASAFTLTWSHSSAAAELPQMRPALVGSGPTALVNMIDAQAIMKKGMDHGAVFFRCLVTPAGNTYRCVAYGGTPGSDALRQELTNKLYRAHFIPAVYNHHNTFAVFYGTAMFAIANGKPHLRVYANQEKSELVEGRDFIGPQAIYIMGHYYDETKYPEQPRWSDERPGEVEMEMTIDATGQLKDVKVLRETPPGKKFGEDALHNIKTATFLPAFRNGQPVNSTTHFTYVFIPGGYFWKK